MTNPALTNRTDLGPIGVELGRSKVRVSLLDRSGRELIDVVERPIAKAGGPRDPIDQEASTRAALLAALDRMGIPAGSDLFAGATIGFSNCGVGSGPALRGWLESLSEDLAEPIMIVGDVGVSYAPARCVEFVQRVFEDSGLHLDRVELAPVAAARMMGGLSSGTVSLGSGVPWTARVLDGQVLEAFEAGDGEFDRDVRVTANGGAAVSPSSLHGVTVAEPLCRNRGVSVAALAPAAGVAVGIMSGERTNLLEGSTLNGPSVRAVTSARTVRHPPAPATSFSREATVAPPIERSAPAVAPSHTGEWARPDVTSDTYRLDRMPDEFGAPDDPYALDDLGDTPDEFAGIEAFAYEEERESRGFNLTDFAIGALAMLAVVLIIVLFVI